jgi:hypothetical protein
METVQAIILQKSVQVSSELNDGCNTYQSWTWEGEHTSLGVFKSNAIRTCKTKEQIAIIKNNPH